MASSDFEEEEKLQTTRRKYSEPRKLMRWDPSEDQGVLLFVDHVCLKNGIPIPWDEVAKLVGGDRNLSGEAIKQHLAKVRAYRVEHGQLVPDKLEKGIRRRASLAGSSANEETPQKGGRPKKIKKEEVDGEEAAEKPKKGSSLLYFKTPKKTKAPKAEAGTNSSGSTTCRGGGRKKKSDTDASGEGVGTPKASTGKRGRKKQTVEEEDGDELAPESPTKKPRTRAKPRVDYREGPAENDDENGSIQNEYSHAEEAGNCDERHDAHFYPATQTSFGSSHASTDGDMPPQSFAAPIGYGSNQGLRLTGSYNDTYGSPPLSGLPMRYAPDMIHPKTIPANANMHYNFSSFQPHIPIGHGGYAEAPDFSMLSDPRREQELREAIGSQLPVGQDDASADVFTDEKAPRKKATPKTKNNRNASTNKAKKTEATSIHQSSQADDPGSLKVENPAVSGDSFTQETSNTIPIVNSTAELCGMFGIDDNKSGIPETMLPLHDQNTSADLLTTSLRSKIGYNGVSSFNNHVTSAPMTPIVDSPIDMFGNHFGTPFAHTGITPSMHNMGFDNFYNSNQLSHTTSHSSSFDSVYQSDSNHAVQSIEPNEGTSFDSGVWNPNEYEMALPGDYWADIGVYDSIGLHHN